MGFVLGESRGRKSCVFPCKVAPAGDERYLVCAAGAAGVEPSAIGSSSVFCNEWLFMCAWFYSFVDSLVADRSVMAAWLLSFCVAMCVERCGFGTWCCKTHCNGCMDVAWASFWEKAGAGNRVFFRVKWLRPAMKGTSCVRRVWLGSNRARSVPPLCSATSGCSCVRDSMRFLTLWLQIIL